MSTGSGTPGQRIDQWLWHARIFKSRSLAARQCRGRKVRVNGAASRKASLMVAPGDVLTLQKANRVQVFRVLALARRRGPAAEARLLYEDLSPPPPPREERAMRRSPAAREPGGGRPTKKQRRETDHLKGRL
ncbi:MAG: RNA-binding S4 domain-containing protein [Proteobacteria bacterium]|nr:RNA-binding S4 domain-containing protein [Pseudomonadota bacterium]